MFRTICFVIALSLAGMSGEAFGQGRSRAKDANFVKSKPTVGDAFPSVTAYTPDGHEWETAKLRGHYAVVTFGCLT